MQDFDLGPYLDRIGLTALGPADPDTLTRLQVAQLSAIPFEGIDAFTGETPSLDLGALTEKLLRRRRGGYCYELNTLFGAALDAAGFRARRVLARVRQRDPTPGARSHLAWLVRMEGQDWLADVGFGGPGGREPIRVVNGTQGVSNGLYRLADDPATGERVLERHHEGKWAPIYSFDGAHVTDAEVAAANHVSSTWMHSPFTNNLMLAGWDGDIRIGVFNRAVTWTGPEGTKKSTLEGPTGLADILLRLGIDLPADLLARVWARLSCHGQ